MDYNGLSKAELVEELKKLHTQLDNLRTAKSARADMPAALQESGETFRTVLDSVFDGVLLADAKTHDFFMANKTICDMLGYSQEEMRELHVENIHPEEDLPEVRGVFGRQLAGELKLAADIPVRRKDGSIFYADINSARVTIGGREYVVGVFRDTTERKEAEEARRELEAEKAVVEKMKELDRMKDEFVSTVTHELRTPMTPLRSTIEMFLDGSLGETTPQQRKFIEMMARNVERLAQFTTEVLTLSRLESGKYKLLPKFLPLMEVVEPVMDLMMTRASGRKSTLKLDIAPELSAFADADSLGMVVTNLTNNAIVHTPEGTSVTISARQLNGDFVEVSVSDTGEGIEQEHLEYLFQRFYQAKRRASATYKGTGIGLAVCKALVEAMGGGISVESHVGEGTSFRFTLPARRA
jgi:PAS domain S-box-containing protein